MIRLAYVAVWAPLLALSTVGVAVAVLGLVWPGGFFGTPSLGRVVAVVTLVSVGWTLTALIGPRLGFDPDEQTT
jgi:hypothetical protein